MRTLALAIAAALPVWLAAPAAQALCTSGIDCIRERFGTDRFLRQNRILDRADRIGTGAPVNSYVAGQSRGPAGLDTTPDVAGIEGDAPPPGSIEIRPGVFYSPGGALGAPRVLVPGAQGRAAGGAPELSVRRYDPALPAPVAPDRSAVTPNQPAAPADLGYSAGANR